MPGMISGIEPRPEIGSPMADVVDRQTRSRMMSGIRGADTKPEIAVRKALHAAGFRYRLHVRDLPGRPDIVLPRHRAVIFVHGCFWHRHDCHLFRWPATRNKISGNVERDRLAIEALLGASWRVLVIWECALKGKTRIGIDAVIEKAVAWIGSSQTFSEISGSG